MATLSLRRKTPTGEIFISAAYFLAKATRKKVFMLETCLATLTCPTPQTYICRPSPCRSLHLPPPPPGFLTENVNKRKESTGVAFNARFGVRLLLKPALPRQWTAERLDREAEHLIEDITQVLDWSHPLKKVSNKVLPFRWWTGELETLK